MGSRKDKKVVVIGGGPSGRTVINDIYKYAQKQKDVKVEVVLVDRKEYGENTPAAVRAWIVPALVESLAISLQEFFPKVENPSFTIQTLVGEVSKISPNSVQIRRPTDRHTYEDGPVEDIPFDSLIVASGAQYPVFKGDHVTLADRKEELNQWAARINASNHVLIVGGGAVGVEIAGEILELHPKKHVTIVHSDASLLTSNSQYTQNLTLRRFLSFPNVKVHLGQRVDLDEVRAHGLTGIVHEYRTTSDEIVAADVAVITAGLARANTSMFEQELADSLTPQGYVKINPTTLQVEGHDNIFALGDVAHFGNAAKLAANAPGQSDVVAKNVLAQLRESKLPAKYKSGNQAPLLLTLGPRFGIMEALNLFGRRPSGAWVSSLKTKFVFGKLTPTQWK